MDNKSIIIHHSPFGNEQPYFQQPFERFPRSIVPKEPFAVGLSIFPSYIAQTVQVLYHIKIKPNENNYVTSGIVDAVCIGNSDSVGNSDVEKHWMAVLPGIEEGHVIHYSFDIDTGDGHLFKGPFTCFSGTICKAQYLESWIDYKEDGVLCKFATGVEQKIYARILCHQAGPSCIIGLDEDVDISCITTDYPLTTYRWRITEKNQLLTLEGIDLQQKRICTVSINLQNCAFMLFNSEGILCTTSCAPPTIHTREGSHEKTIYEIQWDFISPKDEQFIGFGERYTELNHRGSLLYNRVYEQYKNQRLRTYIPIPFFFTNKGWSLHIDTKREIEFDMCSKNDQVWSVLCDTDPKKGVRFDFALGSPLSLCTWFALRFRNPDPIPSWALGPWMSSNEWNSQKRVEEVVHETKKLNIPATVLVLEAWSDETTFFMFNDAHYAHVDSEVVPRLSDFSFPSEGRWPDPVSMVASLKDDGLHLILWQIPVIKYIGEQHHPLHNNNEQFVQKHDYVLHNPDGSPYEVTPGWFRKSMVLDFDNSQASQWWFSRRRYLLEEVGVEGFKTDGGEHIWGRGVYGKGGSGDEIINTYPQSYIRAYTNELRSTLGKGAGVLFSRSGYAGSRATPAHWSGDQDSTWETYRSVVRAMIHASVCAIVYMGWDIGGFTGDFPSSELYLRSTAAATFSPIMQYHSEFNHHRTPCADRTPWNVGERNNDERVVPIYRLFSHLRMALIPYIQQEALHATNTGEPLIRPQCLYDPSDLSCWKQSDSYFFGRSLLIFPVIQEGITSMNIYLPTGDWINLWTEEKLAGGSSYTVEVPLSSIPVYILQSKEVPSIPHLQQVRQVIHTYSTDNLL